MRKDELFIWIAIIFLFTACGTKNIRLSGDFDGGGNRFLVVRSVSADDVSVVDSVRLQNGHFEMKISVNDTQPVFYQLNLSEEDGFTTLARSGDRLSFKGVAGHLAHTCEARGSRDAQLMTQLDHRLALFADSVSHLEQIYGESADDSLHALVESVYLKIKQNHTDFLRKFIQQNPHSLAILPAFYQRYNQAVFLDAKADAELLRKMLSDLKPYYEENKNVKQILERKLDDD